MPWTSRLINLFRGGRLDAEIDEELAFHIEARIAEAVAAGRTPEDARQDALRRFGGRLRARESSHDANVVMWLETAVKDVRYAVRGLRRSPALAGVVLASLTLAIGANTAMFSLVNGVLFRPLPYRDADRLTILWTSNALNGSLEQNTSLPNVADWQARSRSFEDLAVYRENDGPLTEPGAPAAESEWIVYVFASTNLFPLIGRSPAFGRVFDAQDATNGRRVALVSYGLWQRRFGGARDVLGRLITIGGVPVEIVGVMGADFWFPSPEAQIWMPAYLSSRWRGSQSDRGTRFGAVLGRVRPGVTVGHVRAEMRTIARQLEREYPVSNANLGVNVVALRDQINGNSVPFMLLLLFGAVICVLLIACANVASLLLARSLARRREIAVRSALGAGRSRIVRQLLTESVLLSCVAGCLGLAMAAAFIRVLPSFAPADIVRVSDVHVDISVLLFTFVVSVGTGVIFGLAPAIRTANQGSEWLHARHTHASGFTRSLRGAFVVSQFALSVVLVAASGLMLRSLWAVRSVDSGFGDRQVLTARLRFDNTLSRSQRVARYDAAFERIRRLPGVRAAGGVATMFWNSDTGRFGLRAVEGQPPVPREQWDVMAWTTVGGDYFQALGVPLKRGRLFEPSDRSDAPPVVLINETMARRYWPGEDPVGHRIKGFDPRGKDDEWVTVVGVVGDVRSRGLDQPPMAQIFEAQGQSRDETENVVVSASSSAGLPGALRSAIRDLDRTTVVSDVATLDDVLTDQTAPRRFETAVLTAFAILALALASAGIFGSLHYSVVQRRQEIGIRMAIGARPAMVLAMILREGLALASTGVVMGIAAAIALMRVLRTVLFGVTPSDPATFAAVAVILAATAIAGCLMPAVRASRVDPLLVLRAE